ncbi:MAG: hypothetical protein H0W50_04355 [Parachlamydiaceae bacterium]|nr:hypothetical protein [Parachlamydiaceae bacterium]
MNSLYRKFLLSVEQPLIDIYFQPNGNYLKEVTFQNECYFGCHLPSPTDISQLELLELHIFSLLKRLIPNYPYDSSSLVLFPVVEFLNEKV